jgi:hypothetical protein
MRFKIILLSYLLKVPRYFGFNVWSPFLFEDIAIAMLNLAKDRKVNRKWQSDFFKKNKINLEDMNLRADYRNVLDLNAFIKIQPKPLNISILKEIINPNYLEWINLKLSINYFKIFFDNTIFKLLFVPKIGGLMRRIGFKSNHYNYNNELLKAYNAYLTIKPIENLLIRRNFS